MDPLYIYLIILVGGLVIAGLALLCLRFIFKRPLRSVEATYLSWLVMIPVCLAVILFGRIAIILGLLALSLAGFYEFAKVTNLQEDKFLSLFTGLLIVATSVVVLVPGPDENGGWWGLFIAMPVYCVASLLVVPVIRNRCQGQLQLVSLAVVGYIYIGWMFAHAAWLANSQHRTAYLLFLMVAIGMTDISAFLFGKMLGRHPIRSNVSPQKTWEGSLGAFAVAMSLPWLLRPALPEGINFIQLILFGLVIGIGGQLGDLAISAIKRDLHTKDMGSIIPGHGGILDRLDSLIFAAPLYFHTLNYFESL